MVKHKFNNIQVYESMSLSILEDSKKQTFTVEDIKKKKRKKAETNEQDQIKGTKKEQFYSSVSESDTSSSTRVKIKTEKVNPDEPKEENAECLNENNSHIKKNKKRKKVSTGTEDQIKVTKKVKFYSSVSGSDTSNSTQVKVKKDKPDKPKEKITECLDEKNPHKPKKKNKLLIPKEEANYENGELGSLTQLKVKKKKLDEPKKESTECLDEQNPHKPKKKKKLLIPKEESDHENGKLGSLSPTLAAKTLSNEKHIDTTEELPRSIRKKAQSLSCKKLHLKPPDFEVPQLHKLLNRASKPNAQQRALLKVKEIEPHYGKYLKYEDRQILENWQHFIEVNQLPDDPTRFYYLDKRVIYYADKQQFIYYLARNLPKRTPYSVFKRFRLLVFDQKKGHFSPEEDQYILKKLAKRGTKKHWGAVKIAQKLNRSVQSITKRREALESQYRSKIKFNGKNAATFIKYLIKVTGIPKYDIKQLQGRPISPEEWAKLSKKMDNLPVRILQKTWLAKLHPALFVPDDVNDIADVKFKLIQTLSSNNETEWKSISWAKYVPYFEGFTSLRLYILMNQLVKRYVPTQKRHNLKKCLKKLLKVKREDMPSRPIEKITYENGSVSQRPMLVKAEVQDDS